MKAFRSGEEWIAMLVFHHLPRTGGTFLLGALKQDTLGRGPEVSFGSGRLRPRWLCDAHHRPRVLVHHCSAPEFLAAYHPEPGDFVFTLLRHPVEYVYSNFAYMQARVLRGDMDDDPRWHQFRRDLTSYVDDVIDGVLEIGGYPESLAPYDLVGVTERMSLSLGRLNAAVGTRLRDGPPVNAAPCARDYRRRELAQVLAGPLAIYRQALSGLEPGLAAS